MLRPVRFALALAAALLVFPAAAAVAAPKMPIGFFDDPSFRWSPDRAQNLQAAAAAGASVIHTTADWSKIAPTRPKDPANGNDPAYKLGDLDELVYQSGLYGLRVMIDITGTPRWANGGLSPNHMPRRLSDLTTFARMLATRYDGQTGHGSVSLWAVWNEPNLGLFLEPQFVVHRHGKKTTFTIVGPANYAKLYRAAYAGIHAGNPYAQVAIGETSARGRDKPLGGVSDSVAPATFARLLAQQRGLKFAAWAHHPYPTTPTMHPLQKVRYPNVSLASLPKFESDLKRWFHRAVPIWITEYGHETKPEQPRGIAPSTQAAYARQALTVAKNDPNVQMFIWFTFRDSSGNPWKSGIELPSGAPKPSYFSFSALAKLIDGTTQTVKAGRPPVVRMWFPYLAYYSQPGSTIGMTYKVYDGGHFVAVAQPAALLQPDYSVVFVPKFTPVKGHTYTITVTANEVNGHTETRTVDVVAT